MKSAWLGSASLFAAAGLIAAATPRMAWSATDAATAPPPAAANPPADYDPFERVNRGSYRVNAGLDKAIIRPIALGYKAVLPRPIRTGVRNVINNINEPNTVMNDVLQARPERGAKAAGRFIVNSTVGILGLIDVASTLGLEHRPADFGQTLGRWGLEPGPYIFVPVLGPSDLRDGFGRIVDSFTGLLDIHDLHVDTAARFGVAVVDGIDTRAELDSSIEDLNRTATDPYVAVRSVYLQNRQSMITDTSAAVGQLPSFDAPPPGQTPPPQTPAGAPATPNP